MPINIIKLALIAFPHVNFTNAYGLTETSSTIAVLDPDDHREANSSDDPEIHRRLGSVGKPLPSVEIEIRDDEGNVMGHRNILTAAFGEILCGFLCSGINLAVSVVCSRRR